MGVIVELSVFPMDKGVSVSPYVARALKIIESSGLSYAANPMGTCIEGEWPAVLKVVDQCFKDLQNDCDRIYLTMKAASVCSLRSSSGTKAHSLWCDAVDG